MKNGVPFDVAFQLDDLTRAGFCIILSEHSGAEWDWSTMRFKDPPK